MKWASILSNLQTSLYDICNEQVKYNVLRQEELRSPIYYQIRSQDFEARKVSLS